MTNRSWKVNNHGFDFRKGSTILDFRKRKHYFVNFTALWSIYPPIQLGPDAFYGGNNPAGASSWQLTSI